MRIVRRATTIGVLVVSLLLPFVAAGCSGGGGGDDGPNEFLVTITACDAVTYASQGVICIEFTVTGPQGSIDLAAEFLGGPGSPVEGAYEVPPALATQLGIAGDIGDASNIQLAFNGDSFSGRFYWFAGADLGFVTTVGLQFFLTPLTAGTNVQVGPVATCNALNYTGGGMTQLGGGPPALGRSAHCAEHVGGKSVAVAGGYAGTMMIRDSFERFTVDTANFTYSKNVSALLMQEGRAQHACSFFLDPVTAFIKVLATGGGAPGPTATADVYCFSPTESVSPTTGNMNVARSGHTATWIPSNKVVIIGGSGLSTTLNSIEIYDPVTDDFQLLTTTMGFPRREHTATLLPSGKILVAGGFDNANPTTPLPAELFDPNTSQVMTVMGSSVDRVEHTATRLANGWILLAGGLTVSSNQTSISPNAQIFEPELGGMGQFTTTMPLMNTGRALHAASLLGDGHVLVTGGQTSSGPPFVTQSAELFLYHSLTFTPIIPMLVPRSSHSSTATSCGSVVVFGGSNDVGGTTNILGSLEFYPFENTNPVVATAFTGTTGVNGTVYVLITVEDADADGGYVIIRYRPGGIGMFRLCTIDQQNPSTAAGGFPNMQVAGAPGAPQPYSFRWNFAADGLTSGQSAEIEVLPVGATLGSPVRFTITLP